MLEVSDSGEGFNYGFKATPSSQKDMNKENSQDDEINTDAIADDAFLMVSQLHWEDEVVWDGNDIKVKVMQKLNSKTNAAGWLPSSGSRTAVAFSQPGRNIPVAGTQAGKIQAGANAAGAVKPKTNQM